MSLANDNKNWAGNQSDSTMNRVARPIGQPPCDLPSQHQFADSGEYGGDYIEVKLDKWGNERPVDWRNHEENTAGEGAFGNRQFSSNSQDLQSTGYGKNEGLNIIEHGTGAAFDNSQRISVDTSRADRGKEA